MAKVDIVIPCYNYGHFLEACVRSVLEQSLEDIRVLIIDDASLDNSLSVANRLASDDRRVSVISHARNVGHINTYNEGINWVSADYFLLLSADDLLVPGALERAAEIMDLNPDIVLTHGIGVSLYKGSPVPKIDICKSFSWARHDLISEMCTVGGNIVSTPTVVVRSRVQKEIGGYQASLPHSADMEIWLRFAAHGAVGRIECPQAVYRKHSTAMSNSYISEILRDYRQCKAAFDLFFDTYADRVLHSSSLRTRGYRALGRRAFQSGIESLRRGRMKNAASLVIWSIDLAPQLRYFPPLLHLLRIPGPDGREWALSYMRRVVGKAFGRM